MHIGWNATAIDGRTRSIGIGTVALLAIAVFAVVVLAAPSKVAHAQQPDGGFDESSEDGVWLYAPATVSILNFVEFVAERVLQAIFIFDEQELMNKEVRLYGYGVFLPSGSYYNLMLAMLKIVGFGVAYFGEDTATNRRIYEIQKLEELGRHVGVVNVEGETTREQIDNLEESAQFVTMVIHLDYADPTSVQRALLNMVTRPGGNIQPITGVNAILVSDFEYQIKRMAELLYILDRPGPQLEMAVIPVQYAEAGDVVTTVGNLLQSRQRAQQRQGARAGQDDEIFLESDVRTNAIIVQALPEKIMLVRQLIGKLDIPIEGEVKGRIHIYFCKHSDAEQLETILNQLIGNDTFTRDPTQPTQPGQPLQPRFRGAADDEQQPNVVSDTQTNSLIITATAEEYLEIKSVIEQLDIRKPQVLIEAAFVEIRSNDSLEFGIELAEVDQPGPGEGVKFFGGTAFGFSELVDDQGVPISQGGGGLAGRSPLVDGALGFFGGLWQNSVFNIPILIRALQVVSDVNVLSQPRLLTNDNEEAEIKVEDQVPTSTSTTTQSSTDRTGFGGYEEAGITLTVTPHISDEDYLRLEIDVAVEDFLGASRDPSLPPPKTSRSYNGIITVPNMRTVVIGGLTRTEATKTVTKIPLLGDIPLIGELFRSTVISERKTNVYIFLRPVILRDPDFNDLRQISYDDLVRAQSETLETAMSQEFFENALNESDDLRFSDEGRSRARHRYLGIDDGDDFDGNGDDDTFLPSGNGR